MWGLDLPSSRCSSKLPLPCPWILMIMCHVCGRTSYTIQIVNNIYDSFHACSQWMLILDCLSNPAPRTALAGPRSLHCNIKSLNIYWISLVFANVLKPNKMLTTPALFRLFRVNCPVGQKEMFLKLDGNLVRELILWLFKMMIKIIDMWMIMIPEIWLNFSFRGLRICGKVGIGSANETGIDIKNSKFIKEEEKQKCKMCILCHSLLCTSLDILASLPWSPLCSLQCSLLCSLPCIFAGFTGVIGLTSVTGLTEKQCELYIFAKKFKYPVYHLFLSAENQFKFWSYLLLLLLLQLVSELDGSSYAALVGSLMISFRLANLLINNLDFHTLLLLIDQTYHFHIYRITS